MAQDVYFFFYRNFYNFFFFDYSNSSPVVELFPYPTGACTINFHSFYMTFPGPHYAETYRERRRMMADRRVCVGEKTVHNGMCERKNRFSTLEKLYEQNPALARIHTHTPKYICTIRHVMDNNSVMCIFNQYTIYITQQSQFITTLTKWILKIFQFNNT